MSLFFEERPSDSPLVEKVTQGYTVSEGTTIRPAEVSWHLVLTRHEGGTHCLAVGPLSSAGTVTWGPGAEILWIKFKVGTYMPHLPTRGFLDVEAALPGAGTKSFWLKGAAWQFPTYENVDTFIDRLAREEILVRDPIVAAVLQDEQPDVAPRTIRHRFLHTTGMTQNHIRQFERAQRAAGLLASGMSILDTVYEAGYFDQPHLTRALKHWVGYTPAQIVRANREAACQPTEEIAATPLRERDALLA